MLLDKSLKLKYSLSLFRASDQVSLSASPIRRICGYKTISTDICNVLTADVIASTLEIAKSLKTAQGTSLEKIHSEL